MGMSTFLIFPPKEPTLLIVGVKTLVQIIFHSLMDFFFFHSEWSELHPSDSAVRAKKKKKSTDYSYFLTH